MCLIRMNPKVTSRPLDRGILNKLRPLREVPLYALNFSLVFNLISALGVKNMYLIENSLT